MDLKTTVHYMHNYVYNNWGLEAAIHISTESYIRSIEFLKVSRYNPVPLRNKRNMEE